MSNPASAVYFSSLTYPRIVSTELHLPCHLTCHSPCFSLPHMFEALCSCCGPVFFILAGGHRSAIAKLPSLLYAAMLNTTNKSNFTEARVYLGYCLITGDLWGKSGQDHKAGTEAEALEEHCFVAFSSWAAQLDFLHNPGSPAQGWHCPQWTAPPPRSTINQ